MNQLKQKVLAQWVCDAKYNFENAAIAKREAIKNSVERDLPNMFVGENSVICASDAYSDERGTCPGDSGAPLMLGVEDRKTIETLTTLYGVLHGGLEKCDNSEFPAIYTRVTTPHIWNWLMEEFINKSKKIR